MIWHSALLIILNGMKIQCSVISIKNVVTRILYMLYWGHRQNDRPSFVLKNIPLWIIQTNLKPLRTLTRMQVLYICYVYKATINTASRNTNLSLVLRPICIGRGVYQTVKDCNYLATLNILWEWSDKQMVVTMHFVFRRKLERWHLWAGKVTDYICAKQTALATRQFCSPEPFKDA